LRDGEPLITGLFEVDRRGASKRQRSPGHDSVVDMIEIGAGGGSIARVDALGLLKVGPTAPVAPGPACYGRRHVAAVTDADLVWVCSRRQFSGGDMN